MQPGKREVEMFSVQHNAAQSARQAQPNDRRLCLQIHFLDTSLLLCSRALVTEPRTSQRFKKKKKSCVKGQLFNFNICVSV